MRTAFVNELIALAERDSRVLLLTGDLGFMVLESFAERFPDRFFNVGAAEQNMVAMATGLAEAGFVPFVYSIAPFATLRPLEFLRNGPIFHHLPVRVISVGGGFAYGFGGKSHHSLEDLAILRSYQDLTLIVPADPAQAASSITATETCSNPVFFRLDKNDHAHLDALNGNFSLGNMNMLHTGSDCSIIASGSIAIEADSAVKKLKRNGISATLAIVSSFNPSPFDDLLSLPKPWITVEEHITSGGLGGWVSETATDAGILTKVLRLGVTKNSQTGVGSQNWFRKIHGIDSAGITKSVTQFIDVK